MVSIQQKIVDEIVDEYKNNEHVIGVCVFGSVAAGKERSDSDVDLEAVTKNIWEMMQKEYPYIFYTENNKILFDKIGFVKEALNKSKKYLEDNIEVRDFWRKEYNLMRELKASGQKPKNFITICDEAETRFSSYHSVKRDILTPEFFHKHIKEI